jgi:hypothetical protein
VNDMNDIGLECTSKEMRMTMREDIGMKSVNGFICCLSLLLDLR